MAGPFSQNNVSVFANAAALRSAQGSALPPVVYLQGLATLNDGGQAFYALGAFGQADNGTTILVTSDNYCFNQATIPESVPGGVIPISEGGTGQNTAVKALDALFIQGANIASATTTDLSAATGQYVNVTGTTTITGLGTVTAGNIRFVKFTGILTLTYNATSLILPGQASITTAAGDTAIFLSLGSGNWQALVYTQISGGSAGVLPISEGGTGQITSVAAFDALFAQGTNITAATTTAIGGSTGPFINVTGNTTITAFGTVTAGTMRWVKFTGTPLLTYNATSLILPGAANIQAAANDFGLFSSLGSGNWICLSYQPASGQPVATVSIAKGGTGQTTSVLGFNALQAKGADIASATTTDLSAATGPFVNITGAVTITGFGTVAAGTQALLRFTGAPLLTYNATSLILPTSANIQAAAGDTALMESLGSGNWRCLEYMPFTGQPVATVSVAKGGTGNASAATSLAPTQLVISATGTYTPSAGMTSCIIECVGGGGGGGGPGASSVAQMTVGGGGGAGGYSRGLFTAAQIGASKAATVGAAGAAGSSSTGGTGGTTSLGSLIQATGGFGGAISNSGVAVNALGGIGGIGTLATANSKGAAGTPGLGNIAILTGYGGTGGASVLGGGALAPVNPGVGNDGGPYGGGGSGGFDYNAGGAKAGGAGGIGVIIITEFYT